MAKNKGGRPTKITPIIVKKLEEAYLFDCTDKEACFYADISPAALYMYQKRHPEFIERKESLKLNTGIKARKVFSEHAAKDPRYALDYLKKKRRDEYGDTPLFLNEGDNVNIGVVVLPQKVGEGETKQEEISNGVVLPAQNLLDENGEIIETNGAQ